MHYRPFIVAWITAKNPSEPATDPREAHRTSHAMWPPGPRTPPRPATLGQTGHRLACRARSPSRPRCTGKDVVGRGGDGAADRLGRPQDHRQRMRFGAISWVQARSTHRGPRPRIAPTTAHLGVLPEAIIETAPTRGGSRDPRFPASPPRRGTVGPRGREDPPSSAERLWRHPWPDLNLRRLGDSARKDDSNDEIADGLRRDVSVRAGKPAWESFSELPIWRSALG